MPHYVFHMKVREGSHDELRELNQEYGPALEQATREIPGFRGIVKYVVGDDYVEVVDCDESFEEFGQRLASNPEVREFLRAVGGCFEQSLREMGERRMDCIQRIGDGSLAP